MRIFFSLLISSFCFSVISAQNVIRGTVIDNTRMQPLSGATVITNGKPQTQTNAQGKFELPCSGVTELSISYIGYQTQKLPIRSCNEDLNIYMVPINGWLSAVEITATSSGNTSMLYQPQSIVQLNATELKRGTGLFLDDAINTNVPGVSFQRRAISSGQQFNIRGYGNGMGSTTRISSNFDGQGVKVYLNGMPITDAEGITLMDDIDFGNLGGVEVTKGPTGSLYGLAIAGVVNLKTISPEKGKTSIEQEVMAGSYDLRRSTTRFTTAGENYKLLLTYGKQSIGGFAAHMDSRKDFVNVLYEVNPSDKQNITAYAGYSNSYDERGGELTLTQFAQRDYSGNPEYIKRNAHSEIISYRAGVGHNFKISNTVTHRIQLFGTGINGNASSASGWTDKLPLNYGLRTTIDINVPLKNGAKLSGIAGLEIQEQRASVIGYNMVANPTNPTAYWIIGSMRSNVSTISSTGSYFTEWTLGLKNSWSITAGLGISNMRIELNDRFYVAGYLGPTNFSATYKAMASPKLAINKVFNEKISAYASFSRGYKAPVSSYFYIPATGKLNTGLKPERGDQFELGTKGLLAKSKLSYELALYVANFNDKMTAIAVPLDGALNTTAYSYVANGGRQVHKGIEMMLQYHLIDTEKGWLQLLKPFGNVTIADCKYDGYSFQTLNANRTGIIISEYSGKAVAGVAPFVTNMGVDIKLKGGWYGNVVYNYREAFPITADGVNNTASYSLLSAKWGYRKSLSNHWQLDASYWLNNITNTQYATMVFVNQLPDAYVPAPDKANGAFTLQLKYTF
ncbi:MAG: TonB-dependent receptor [Chitinophagia bacterium]|nr:TonB-dependent receptor [Chitinophagia bacterium]